MCIFVRPCTVEFLADPHISIVTLCRAICHCPNVVNCKCGIPNSCEDNRTKAKMGFSRHFLWCWHSGHTLLQAGFPFCIYFQSVHRPSLHFRKRAAGSSRVHSSDGKERTEPAVAHFKCLPCYDQERSQALCIRYFITLTKSVLDLDITANVIRT